MMGISWGGFNALQVAAKQPPALKAIITLCSTDDRYADDIHYKGGLLLNENMGWGATMLSYSSRPPDPALVGEQMARNVARAAGERAVPAGGLAEAPAPRRLLEARLGLRGFFRDQGRDAGHRRLGRRLQERRVAAGRRNSMRRPRESSARGSTNIRISPCPKPAIGFLQEALRWWDRWLKDIDTGVENDPAMRLYLMDSVPPRTGTRSGRAAGSPSDDWPSPDIATQALRLGDRRQLWRADGRAAHRRSRSPRRRIAAWRAANIARSGSARNCRATSACDDEKSACFDSASSTPRSTSSARRSCG